MKRRTDAFCITRRLRLQDSILIDNKYVTIHKLIDSDPVLLWNIIHSKGSKDHLVPNVHHLLKQVISKTAPELIAINDVKRELRKSRMKLSKAINTGTIGTDKSSYKKLD
jgi:hypothetical protein